jgi:hypothetical protein
LLEKPALVHTPSLERQAATEARRTRPGSSRAFA